MIVLPGENVGSEEEFIPGKGVMVKDGELIAISGGPLQKENQTVAVERAKEFLRPGDVALGRVEEIYEKQALIRLASSKPFFPMYGRLKIENMAPFYVRDIRQDVFKKGDIVVVKVIGRLVDGTYDLSMRDADLGVVQAYCGRCRHRMKRTGRAFFCNHCIHLEKRKVPLVWNGISSLLERLSFI